MDVKVGDTVHVRGKVLAKHDMLGVLVDCGDSDDSEVNLSARARVNADSIVHVEPRPLQVGDSVQVTNSLVSPRMEIVAIADKHVWCKWPSGDHYTYLLENVERVS